MSGYIDYMKRPKGWDDFPLFGEVNGEICMPMDAKVLFITSLEHRRDDLKADSDSIVASNPDHVPEELKDTYTQISSRLIVTQNVIDMLFDMKTCY